MKRKKGRTGKSASEHLRRQGLGAKKGHSARRGNAPSPYTKYAKRPYAYGSLRALPGGS
jgi:hypothetical protein